MRGLVTLDREDEKNKYKQGVIEMSSRRIYIEKRSKRSFDITLASVMYIIICIPIYLIYLSPFSEWTDMLILMIPGLIGLVVAWVLKKIEKIEEKW